MLDGQGFTLISDRQKGFPIAVDQELPRLERRSKNIYKSYPGKELPKYLFWAVAKSFNIGDYDRALTALKAFDAGVYEAVLSKNPSNCSRAFFSSTLVFEDLSNNFYGSYNNTLNTAREMPLVEIKLLNHHQEMFHCQQKKKKKRIKGKNESPQNKKKGKGLQEPKKKMIKLSMEGRSSHCGRCEISCYNSRSCPNEGCPVYRPKKQVSRPSQSEGPTQPSQN
ncbi:BnaA06g20220D [Brassica napus]|uniref:BnaA06g20220D protein n=1 Tax=Brassica napus TaxID=3708 RepID=A0A078FH77_BRANA|nr:BnaA06g20220D [Brassica napus]